MTKTGRELDDIGGALSWGALKSFLRHETVDSELFRELNPELAVWSDLTKTNAILADIYDILAAINSNLVAVGSRKPAKKVKPYPRPVKPDDRNERHFGSGALPPDELEKWFERKRAEANG